MYQYIVWRVYVCMNVYLLSYMQTWCCVHMYLCMLATTRKTIIVLRAHVCIYIGCICIYVFMYWISWRRPERQARGHKQHWWSRPARSHRRLHSSVHCTFRCVCEREIYILRESIHTYIHTYMHACIHTYMHTYIHTYIHICIHTCIHKIVGEAHTPPQWRKE